MSIVQWKNIEYVSEVVPYLSLNLYISLVVDYISKRRFVQLNRYSISKCNLKTYHCINIFVISRGTWRTLLSSIGLTDY